jgi:hypothetical protein
MQRFKSAGQAQRFLAAYGPIAKLAKITFTSVRSLADPPRPSATLCTSSYKHGRLVRIDILLTIALYFHAQW